ncbi:MAG: hypothetical protein JRF30_10065 [Deltaproteobacteria bacterium]|nr:hypothetical protein [Deltaproteobacteria bacterium]
MEKPEVIRAKIKEADLYVSHGLFDEDREIYQSLLRHFQAQMESTATTGEQINKLTPPPSRPESRKKGVGCLS